MKAKILWAGWVDGASSDPTPAGAISAKTRIRLLTFNVDANTTAQAVGAGTTNGGDFLYVLTYGLPQTTYFDVHLVP